MLNKTIVLLALVLAVNIVHSQDLPCGRYSNDPNCVPTAVFSVNHVHRVRGLGGLEYAPTYATEASWHKTEQILVTLGPGYSRDSQKNIELKPMKYLDYWPIPHSGTFEIFYTGDNRMLAQDESFSQLAVTSDTIVVGTNTGDLLFWDFRRIPLLAPAPTPDNFLGRIGLGRLSEAGRVVRELPPRFHVSNGEISEILTHPSDEWLLVVIDYSKVFRVDLESKSVTEIEFQAGEDQALKALAFSDDGLWLAAADNESIQIWNTASWAAREPKALSAKSVKKLLFTADDSQLIVLADASVSRWSLSNGRLNFVRELAAYPGKRPCRIDDGDISPDGSLLMTADDCGQRRAWDLTVDQEMFIPQLDFTIPASVGRPGRALQFNPDGRYLFETSNFPGGAVPGGAPGFLMLIIP